MGERGAYISCMQLMHDRSRLRKRLADILYVLKIITEQPTPLTSISCRHLPIPFGSTPLPPHVALESIPA